MTEPAVAASSAPSQVAPTVLILKPDEGGGRRLSPAEARLEDLARANCAALVGIARERNWPVVHFRYAPPMTQAGTGAQARTGADGVAPGRYRTLMPYEVLPRPSEPLFQKRGWSLYDNEHFRRAAGVGQRTCFLVAGGVDLLSYLATCHDGVGHGHRYLCVRDAAIVRAPVGDAPERVMAHRSGWYSGAGAVFLHSQLSALAADERRVTNDNNDDGVTDV